MSLIIRNGRLLDPASQTDKKVDIRVNAGHVAEIAPAGSIKADSPEVLDATGLWILPGLIDLHVHLREPGEEYKEDIESGSRAAAAGGFTTVVAMPNTKPPVDNGEVVRYIVNRAREVGLCRVLPAGCITVGQAGERLAPFGELKHAGAVAVTDDGRPVANASLMRYALQYALDFDLPVLTHAEEPALSKEGLMHEGAMSTRLGMKGIPRLSEDIAVARDIMLAEYTGGRLHVCHVSTAGAVEMIRQAKARGVRVTAEAAPHHFTLTDAAVDGFGTSTKMNPPLREESDRRAVVAGLKDGTITAVATDHAPHSSLEKDTTYDEAANGILGLQTALPLTLDLWRQGELPLMTAIERMTHGPAKVLGLPYGTVAVGAVADLSLVDPEAEWVLTDKLILSKSRNSPFVGHKLKGRAEATVLAGQVVYRRDNVSR